MPATNTPEVEAVETTTVNPETIVEAERPAIVKASKAYDDKGKAFREACLSLGRAVGRLIGRLVAEADLDSAMAEEKASGLVAEALGYRLEVETIRGYIKAASVEASLAGSAAVRTFTVEALKALATVPATAEAAEKAGTRTRSELAEALKADGTLNVRDIREAVKAEKGTPEKASAGTAKRSSDVVKAFSKLAEAVRADLLSTIGPLGPEAVEAFESALLLSARIGREGKAVPPYMRNAIAELFYIGPEAEVEAVEAEAEVEA